MNKSQLMYFHCTTTNRKVGIRKKMLFFTVFSGSFLVILILQTPNSCFAMLFIVAEHSFRATSYYSLTKQANISVDNVVRPTNDVKDIKMALGGLKVPHPCSKLLFDRVSSYACMGQRFCTFV